MALTTIEHVGINKEIMWADFKDTHALYSERSNSFIGYNIEGQLLSGLEPLYLVDGLWILKEDPKKILKYLDLKSSELTLKIIK